MKIEKKNYKWIALGVTGVLLITIGGSTIAFNSNSKKEAIYKETMTEKGDLIVGVTESGTVSIGTLSQEYDVGSNTSGNTNQSFSQGMGGMSAGTNTSSTDECLKIAEVYAAVGQNVEKGTPLYKISEESIADYRQTLKSAVADSSAKLTETKLNSEKQQLLANYNYATSVAKGNVAGAEYNATLVKLQAEVESAQEAVNYYTELEAYYYKLYTEGQTDYEDDYQDTLKKKEEANAKLVLAQNNYSTKALEAQKKYEETVLAYNNASSQYSIDVNGIDSDIDSASDTLDDAKDALTEFEAFVGDGIIYAEYSGKLLSLGYEEGDILSSDTAIATYSDTEAVSMTVSVSQEDISAINIGDEVLIQLTAYEGEDFKGVVSGMDTSSSSGSSTVSYNVTVLFSGDTSKIFTDMTGNVTFIQKQISDVVFVSNKAIRNEGTKSYVKLKTADGSFEKREVSTGFSNGVYVEVKSGLNEGEIVIIESQVVKK